MIKESDLSQFTGTQGYHPWSGLFRKMVLSDGALFLAEQANAFWLMDAIASHQPTCMQDKMLRDIQFWTLRVKDGKGILTCQKDSGYKPTVTQEIDFTDFPFLEVKLYVGPLDGETYVIYLPSEY